MMGRSVVDNGEMRILALIFCENVEKRKAGRVWMRFAYRVNY